MDKLREWIVPILETKGCHLYDIEWLSSERPPLLRISVEKDDGSMDLDTCAICSDAISEILDQKDWFASEYMLEVCSPGAERELKNEEQLQNAIDQYVFCKLKDPKDGLDSVTGNLLEVNNEFVKIEYRNKTRLKTIDIDRNNILMIRTAVKI
ncbi:ribosome maturation factor RimP [Faecalicoccus acidiformans]|uniref:Ribosome maturation factor RimP n=1 Tax=Faecalicoccus acidiformans TaxID=915173 RepID=A0A7W8D0T9_9FIRM|nr:ribosome maturation factor RimP [Faecalicoccus acidiformans]MBB5185142.1 ribosome maturation factor RimP [Faecalicoccus acidiformans]MBM6830852.1 ribosome maturation factor RimP [Faecalicoccus acidiformans]MDM8203955.1 ribosome maturation factor RimP [Faecalicoccus acidiformans]HIW18514.1 ribosome maturation factor RimP [Candidatus Faecalicoccus intestinipullorum]